MSPEIVGSFDASPFFDLYVAGRPDPVSQCNVTNKTYTSLFVRCKAGYDGGLKQSFIIEVHEQRYYEQFLRSQSSSKTNLHQFGTTKSSGYRGSTSPVSDTITTSLPIKRLEMHHEPRFALENMDPGTGFTLVVYAQNSKVT